MPTTPSSRNLARGRFVGIVLLLAVLTALLLPSPAAAAPPPFPAPSFVPGGVIIGFSAGL